MAKYTEDDIKKTIHFLKTNHPEIQPTREEAVKVLNGMQSFSETFVEILAKIKKVKLPKKIK